MRGKRRIHAPFRAPCSSVLFSLHSARTNFARVPVPLLLLLTSSGVPRFSSLSLSLRPLPPPLATAAAAASVSSFCLVGCRQAQRHEKKESGIGPLSSHPVLHLSPARSHSVFSSLSFSHSPPHRHLLLLLSLPLLFLVLAAARWFVNAKFKLSRATLLHEPLCDANEGTNTSTLSKSPREPPPCPYKRRNEHTNETRAGRKGEERRTRRGGISSP